MQVNHSFAANFKFIKLNFNCFHLYDFSSFIFSPSKLININYY